MFSAPALEKGRCFMPFLKKHSKLLRRFISVAIIFAFLATTILPSYAQTVFTLPTPGTMVNPSPAFAPVLLRGMVIHPENPLHFDFIVDSGNTHFTTDQIKEESSRLVKYFLAAMTVPQDDLWVNLSPYEKDRIVPDELGKTELGRDMLAQDYILKQLTASLIHPESDLGKAFWEKVYAQAYAKFGTTTIPLDTFNKVWIIPEEATVFEHGQAVYITKSKLKVLMEEDYVALQKGIEGQRNKGFQDTTKTSNPLILNSSNPSVNNSLTSQIIREIILPEIEREINFGENFAPMRQIYQSLILSQWYKETIKESLLSKVYIDQKKIKGVDLSDPTIKDQIYARYVESFKKGVFDLIKVEQDQPSGRMIPRKYFSGGQKFGKIPLNRTQELDAASSSPVGDDYKLSLRIDPQQDGKENTSSGIVANHIKSIIVKQGSESIPAQVDYINFITNYSFPKGIQDVGGDSDLMKRIFNTIVYYVMETGRKDVSIEKAEIFVVPSGEEGSVVIKIAFKNGEGRVISMVRVTALGGSKKSSVDAMVMHQGPLGGVFYKRKGGYVTYDKDGSRAEGQNLVLITNRRGQKNEDAEVEARKVTEEQLFADAGKNKALADKMVKTVREIVNSENKKSASLAMIERDASNSWKVEEPLIIKESLAGVLSREDSNILTSKLIREDVLDVDIDHGHKVGVIFIGASRYAVNDNSHFKAAVDYSKLGIIKLIGVVEQSIQGDVRKNFDKHLRDMGINEQDILVAVDEKEAKSHDNWMGIANVKDDLDNKIIKFLQFDSDELSDDQAKSLGQDLNLRFPDKGWNIKSVNDLNEIILSENLVDLIRQQGSDDKKLQEILENSEINNLKERLSTKKSVNLLKLNRLTIELLFSEAPKSKRVAVVVTSRSRYHKAYVEWARDQGYHVLVDKPLTGPNPWKFKKEDAGEIANDFYDLIQVGDPDVLLMMATQKRYSDLAVQIIRNINPKEPIQNINLVYNDGWWANPSEFGDNTKSAGYAANQDGGKIAHSGYHFLDLIPWILQKTNQFDQIASVEVHSTFQKPIDIKTYNNLKDRGIKNAHDAMEQEGPVFAGKEMVPLEEDLHEINADIQISFTDKNAKVVTTVNLSMFHGGPFSKNESDTRGWGRVKTETIQIKQPSKALSYSRIAKFYMPGLKDGKDDAVGAKNNGELVVESQGGEDSLSENINREDDSLPAKEFFEALNTSKSLSEINHYVRSSLISHAIGVKLMAAVYQSVFSREGGINKVVEFEISEEEKQNIRNAENNNVFTNQIQDRASSNIVREPEKKGDSDYAMMATSLPNDAKSRSEYQQIAKGNTERTILGEKKKKLTEENIAGALRKFWNNVRDASENFRAKYFPGNTIVFTFDDDWQKKLGENQDIFKERQKAEGLDNMTAFVDKNTFHLTFTDMVNLDDLVNFIPGFAKAQVELEDELTKRGVPKNALNKWIGKFYKKSQNEPGQFSVDAVSVKECIDSGDAEKFEGEREILSKIYYETIQVLREMEKKINDVAIEVLNEIQGLIQTGEIRVKFTGLGSFSDFLILAMFEPSDEPSLQKINEIRTKIYRKVGLLVDPPFAFMLHASLGYHVNKVEEEADFAKYKNIVKSVSEEMKKDGFFNKDVIINNLELRHFDTMYDFEARSDGIIYRIEIEDRDNAMIEEKDVLDIIDHRSNRVSLVGGKAASLKELGSIPGINVPAGFNVTTKVYEEYIESVGAESTIKELEEISEQWKNLDENDPHRANLLKEMRTLAIAIHKRIMEGKIPDSVKEMILESYRKLEKDGEPALVAVRSSATAEDMPDASFAGQYTTYLNIQGEDQLTEAIKGVWASTYYDAEKGNMNPVEYRNKHNLKHSKNKMCALILEMVNPKSAGTAFSVDLETGAPFISVNNSYGLGEAEVAGLVTSDTWIVDPNTGEILKRRLGEKGIKIVYDSDKKLNVKMPTSESERKRFAISRSKAKEIALLVKKIQDHYIQKNPNLNHMDIEYVVTNDDQIIFTQARPETVWTKGTKSLIAINAQEIDALNKRAKKSGKEAPYPEIFKGGVSGSAGVARGILRVVATVKEAEGKVKPGDIMVAPNTTNAWEPVMGRASGIITEIGGPGNHTAVVSREQSKAAIVAAIGAMQTLRMHEGQMVTVDATSKKVYLNKIPQEYEFMPDKIAPQYGSLFSQTLDESWNEAQETMTTTQAPGGTRWINKPNQKVRKFLQEVLTRSHRYVAEKILEIKITDRISVDEENPKVGIYQVDFDTIYPWMTELARRPLDGPDSLSSIHEARVESIRDFLQKSENLTLTEESISAWLDSFIEVNAYMSFAYNIYRITEGLLEDALKRKQLPEPYLSQVWQSMSVWVGETEAIKRNRDYGELLEELKDDDRLRRNLENAVITDTGFNKFALEHLEFFSKFEAHVFNYKIMNNTDDIFSGVPFHGLLAKELLKDVAANRAIAIYDTKPEQFYPEDPEFTRIARLAFFASKLRQDAHHFKVRGQWKFVEVLRPLAQFLIEKDEINVFDDIFDHTPEWIIEKAAEYEKAGLPSMPKEALFHIKPYEIQNLEIAEDMKKKDDFDMAMLTSMGRWQFDSVQWDENSGKLTLVNAKRIEGTVKTEFLEKGQHSPRDIILSARKMTDRENAKVESLATTMGMDVSKIFVISLDQTVAFNRIYGLYSDGIFFIREDVLSEGNQDQIHEALDHLRLKLTELGYEELKEIQYYGNLRGLITKLSHRTIKQKLLFWLYGEKEASRKMDGSTEMTIKDAIIRAILNQLGDQKSEYWEHVNLLRNDEMFYDRVTREMVRNRVGFVEAMDIVNKMNNAVSSSSVAEELYKILKNPNDTKSKELLKKFTLDLISLKKYITREEGEGVVIRNFADTEGRSVSRDIFVRIMDKILVAWDAHGHPENFNIFFKIGLSIAFLDYPTGQTTLRDINSFFDGNNTDSVWNHFLNIMNNPEITFQGKIFSINDRKLLISRGEEAGRNPIFKLVLVDKDTKEEKKVFVKLIDKRGARFDKISTQVSALLVGPEQTYPVEIYGNSQNDYVFLLIEERESNKLADFYTGGRSEENNFWVYNLKETFMKGFTKDILNRFEQLGSIMAIQHLLGAEDNMMKHTLLTVDGKNLFRIDWEWLFQVRKKRMVKNKISFLSWPIDNDQTHYISYLRDGPSNSLDKFLDTGSSKKREINNSLKVGFRNTMAKAQDPEIRKKIIQIVEDNLNDFDESLAQEALSHVDEWTTADLEAAEKEFERFIRSDIYALSKEEESALSFNETAKAYLKSMPDKEEEASSAVGGIDMNEIDVNRQGAAVAAAIAGIKFKMKKKWDTQDSQIEDIIRGHDRDERLMKNKSILDNKEDFFGLTAFLNHSRELVDEMKSVQVKIAEIIDDQEKLQNPGLLRTKKALYTDPETAHTTLNGNIMRNWNEREKMKDDLEEEFRNAENFTVNVMGPHLMNSFAVTFQLESDDWHLYQMKERGKVISERRNPQATNPDIIHSSVAYIYGATEDQFLALNNKLREIREKSQQSSIAISVDTLSVTKGGMDRRFRTEDTPWRLDINLKQTDSSMFSIDRARLAKILNNVNDWFNNGQNVQAPFLNGLNDIPGDSLGQTSIRTVLKRIKEIEAENGWEPGTIAIEGGAVRRLLTGEYLLKDGADLDLIVRIPQLDQSGKDFGRKVLEVLRKEFNGSRPAKDIDSPQEEWFWRGIKMDYVGYYVEDSLDVYYKADIFSHAVEPIAEMWIDSNARIYDPHGGISDLLIDKIARIRGRIRRDIDPSLDFRNFILPHHVLRVIGYKFEYGLDFDDKTKDVVENIYRDRSGFNVPSWQWEWIDFSEQFRAKLEQSDLNGDEIVLEFEGFLEDKGWPRDENLRNKRVEELKDALRIQDYNRARSIFFMTAPFRFYNDDSRKIILRAPDYKTALRARQYLAEIGFEKNIADKIGIDLDQILSERPDSAMASSPSKKGGIDMNEIDVNRQGAGVDIQFDPVIMQDILNNGVDGFVPVIINLTPISSIFPMLGLKDPSDEPSEYYQVSSLN